MNEIHEKLKNRLFYDAFIKGYSYAEYKALLECVDNPRYRIFTKPFLLKIIEKIKDE